MRAESCSLDEIAPELRRAYEAALHSGTGFGDVNQSIIPSPQAVQRSQRNREGGYWIAGSDPGAAQHSVMRAWKLNGVTAVMLTTDGVSDAVPRYGLGNWNQVRAVAERYGADLLLEQIHDVEAADPDGRWLPRSKRHDDKAIALAAFDRAEHWL